MGHGMPRRVGLVVATPRRGRAATRWLVAWLLEVAATRTDVTVDLIDLADRAGRAGPSTSADPADPTALVDPLPERDAWALLVPQWGPVPAPAVEAVLEAHAMRWAEHPVALVAYGGVSRGRDAAARVRATLTSPVAPGPATVLEPVLGMNVAQLRREGGPGAFERVAWELVLDGLAASLAERSPAA